MSELEMKKYGVNYKPSTIIIENEKELTETIETIVDKYNKLVFTDENMEEAKKSRAELNKLSKELDEKRKEIKKGFSEPLLIFEKKIKKYVSDLKNVSDSINNGISNYEDKQKEIREKEILDYIDKILDENESNDISIEVESSWLNKTSFTAKNSITGKVKKEIETKIFNCIEEEREAKEKIAIVNNYALANGFEPKAWILLLDKNTPSEIMKLIDESKKEEKERIEKERLERERVEQENRVIDEVESNFDYSNQSFRSEEEKINTFTNVNNDIENLDPMNKHRKTDFSFSEKPVEENLQTFTLKLTGTPEKLKELNKFIKENGIKVEVIM
ncbi:MAG: protein of unknown function DUF1351 [Caudoviricetes sp.]|nr:MAG: protein of unknown function DUF1351 [Caudoviricetes sp.]